MSISKHVMQFTSLHRETLMRWIPIGILRYAKHRVIERNLRRVAKDGKTPFVCDAFPRGINLIGDVKAEIGLGQSARLLARQMAATDVPFTIYQENMDGDLRASDSSCECWISQTMPYGINVFHINPYELGVAYSNLGKDVWDRHYNIAFWLWELEEFPEDWKVCFPLIDEVWTPSEFISNTIRKVLDVPVVTVPYAMEAPVEAKFDRRYFELPEQNFLFLAMYDCNSTMERKNPMGVIEAFKKAFPATATDLREDISLVLKINNATDEDVQKIQNALVGYHNVYYITDVLTKIEVNSLIACADVFVSLHRAEGFGLVMAEAMWNGTTCIATNWSSNTEFMNHTVACMVSYEKVTIEEGNTQYKKGYYWAEPDVEQAAAYMKRLADDRSYCKELADKAKIYIRQKLSMDRAVSIIQSRIQEIYKNE